VRDVFGESNVAEIERLNQRGGRTLAFCDLVEAGTLSAAMAGEMAALVESGASILTAAVPGGAGKSTVLANLLACLPPGERIVTTPDERAVETAHAGPPDGPYEADAPTCFLAHEIGSGTWYAYLWGRAAARFFDLRSTSRRIATCLHADTIEEVYALLGAQGVSPSAMRSVGVVAFMVRAGGLRRVGSVHVSDAGRHRLRWRWDASEDAFRPESGPAAASHQGDRVRELTRLIGELVEDEVRDFAEQRRRLAEVLGP
jgi:hypothetical protein